ncbi:MAG TPA: hypothetical protein VF570_00720 [Pyrinomonadaceae bacterium]|jgi:hypothetical protein
MMLTNTHQRFHLRILSELVLLALAVFALGSLLAHAQKNTPKTTAPTQTAAGSADADTPLLREYRGVTLGMTAEEARKKLGEPADKSDAQDFYTFSETESAQIFYDASRKVMAISAHYAGGAAGTPDAKTVLGTDVPAKEDGSAYKMVEYKRAGCWVSYSRTAGDAPIVTVSMKKAR